ncbi:hypothetical protein GALMADRAFT_253681 [Galerina marginata CBS 339.88]|uniref:Uncharacterized protein n=1 Tax=Galerina marginata (strain CBS 339.88) TaxID=685588 RepID=A0A067SLX6_GALM3|nr:hypothetical protein GALMADRAFT_253681 [Galerina marginata CBS 339.88]
MMVRLFRPLAIVRVGVNTDELRVFVVFSRPPSPPSSLSLRPDAPAPPASALSKRPHDYFHYIGLTRPRSCTCASGGTPVSQSSAATCGSTSCTCTAWVHFHAAFVSFYTHEYMF